MPSQAESLLHRVRDLGVRGASTVDLIAIGFSRRDGDVESAESMTRDVLARYQGIQALSEVSLEDLRDMAGLEGFEALRVQALLELGRRVGMASKGPTEEIACAEDVYRLLEHLKSEKREHFVVVLLDSKHGVMRSTSVHIGTLTMSVVGAREVFREAIREGASALIVAHNHPSGDPMPSDADIDVTKKLVEVGELLDIPVLDHVIIGERTYCSLKERGDM